MATINITGSATGTALTEVLNSGDIEPGAETSYQLCKTLYIYHPLGAKMAESPIRMAQSQGRNIDIPDAPPDIVIEQFLKEWENLGVDKTIFNVLTLARVYGVASVVIVSNDLQPNDSIDYMNLPEIEVAFNVLDPLNTAGSLVLNQDPNAVDFLKPKSISISGTPYHPSRACVTMNENPIYIAYTNSGFGYVGRSVYQRALFPMKSFVQTMITDDLVTRKAGVLVAMLRAAGSFVDNLMAKAAGFKRNVLKEAEVENGNVISIELDEKVESLNLQNIDNSMKTARTNILENIAVAADMPAKLLNQETFAEGFGEGSEDAKAIAQYIESVRKGANPIYAWFDKIVQHRAWSPEFYETVQEQFTEYKKVPYKEAFYKWQNSFVATWPNLLTEPDSEKVKVEDIKLKGVSALIEIVAPMCDPDNKALLLEWMADNVNENKIMFPHPLELDWKAIAEYEPSQPGMADGMDESGDQPEGASGKDGHKLKPGTEGGGESNEAGAAEAKEPAPPKPMSAAA